MINTVYLYSVVNDIQYSSLVTISITEVFKQRYPMLHVFAVTNLSFFLFLATPCDGVKGRSARPHLGWVYPSFCSVQNPADTLDDRPL